MYILGISAFYHDSAACLISNGQIIAATQEERFSRIKHDASFPNNSVRYALNKANIRPEELDYIVFYDKPLVKFERLLETYFAFAPNGIKSFINSFPVWIKEKIFLKKLITGNLNNLWELKKDYKNILLFSEHHLSHAASAFFPSPFADAAVLTMDGVGEWATTTFGVGKNNELSIHKEIYFPHSIGLLYSAFTYYTGFKVNSGEYKLMGLSPYGEPKYTKLIKDNLIDIKDDGSFALDMNYFDFCTGDTMTNNNFNKLFGSPPRKPETELTQREMDLAASIQIITEEVVLKLAQFVRKSTKQKNLCLAGGVALNCVANGRLLRSKTFEKIWIQPAAGDAGGALGAALAVYHIFLNKPRKATESNDFMLGSYLGPEFNQLDIENRLSKIGALYKTYSEDEIIKTTAHHLADGKAVGWFNGRMEFGPRALGNRSILADPRSRDMQKLLNLKVKFRESFRPFAPSILREDVSNWFEINTDSPYMLLVADVILEKRKEMTSEQNVLFGIDKLNVPRSDIPAVTHVDFSARIQTVHASTNPKYHKLIKMFKNITGCPVLVNTSFNIRGEPIVCTPEDAYKCFMGTELDVLIIGNSVMLKTDQPIGLTNNYSLNYGLD